MRWFSSAIATRRVSSVKGSAGLGAETSSSSSSLGLGGSSRANADKRRQARPAQLEAISHATGVGQPSDQPASAAFAPNKSSERVVVDRLFDAI